METPFIIHGVGREGRRPVAGVSQPDDCPFNLRAPQARTMNRGAQPPAYFSMSSGRFRPERAIDFPSPQQFRYLSTISQYLQYRLSLSPPIPIDYFAIPSNIDYFARYNSDTLQYRLFRRFRDFFTFRKILRMPKKAERVGTEERYFKVGFSYF